MSVTSALIILAVVAFVFYKWFGNKTKNLPPGPIAWPVIGNLLQIGQRPYLVFMKWAEIYGPIFRVQMGSEMFIVIDDPKLMKEVFSDPIFSGKPDSEVINGMTKGPNGIINSEGESWEAQRRFTLKHLRDFGFGKNYMENLIMDEVREVIEWLKKEEGQPISVNRKFGLALVNSLWTIFNGTRFSQDDPKLLEMMTSTTEIIRDIMKYGGLVLFAPWAKDMFPTLSGWTKMKEVQKKVNAFFGQIVHEAKSNYSDGQVRHFVDNYISEIEKTTDPNSSFYKEKGYVNLQATVSDIFQAGSETTSTTLTWAILYLTANPEVQRNLRQEIDDVLGQSRPPSLTDKPTMQYTEAVIMEVLRMSTLVPMGAIHVAFADKEVRGFMIPKNAWLIPNIYSAHYNPKTWGDPENFRPERFIGVDGKAKKHESLVPFQIGKRQCLGEPFARDVLFMFLTSIYQRFETHPVPNGPKLDLEPLGGPISLPKEFNVVMKDRLK